MSDNRNDQSAQIASRMAMLVVPIFSPLLREEEAWDAYREIVLVLEPEVKRVIAGCWAHARGIGSVCGLGAETSNDGVTEHDA